MEKTFMAYQIIKWFARILSLLCISFVLLFVIGEGYNPFKIGLSALGKHIFFPFGVCIGLIVAWRKDWLGGIISILSFAGFYILHYFSSGRLPKGPWFFIIAFPGILFLLAYFISRLKKQE